MTLSCPRSAPIARLRLAGRVFVLALLAAGAVGVWLHRGDLDPSTLTSAIAHYPAAPLIFIALHVIASLLFVPRTMMGVVAGLIFGLWWGIVWTTLGSLAGAVTGFLLARYVNGGLIDLESLPRFGPVLQRAEAGGWRAVTMLRLVPLIPHTLSNYALGLTRLSLGGYTVGSLLGQMPMTIAYVSFGAAGERASAGGQRWLVPALIGAAALALSLLLPRLHKNRIAASNDRR
jgi:uncharacterized membrane protein YdjX (TVP38/TMEM64 family)